MDKPYIQRVSIFIALALAMAVTRIHHFDVLPDASWAIFFLAGFWLRGSARWAFPLLMAEAVLVDFVVITQQGMNFWSQYCVSPAYWFLIAAYGALWLGGSWLARHQAGLRASSLGLAALALLVSEGVCYLLSNGSFYWLSPVTAAVRSMDGWFANLGDWYLPFLGTTAMYVAIGAVFHVLVTLLARTADSSRTKLAG